MEPPERKEVRIHGVRFRATRNPKKMCPIQLGPQPRYADRRYLGLSLQEPPRITRMSQSPCSHALPSAGAPT